MLLEGHDELHRVERVGSQSSMNFAVGVTSSLLHPELLYDDLLHLLID